MSAVHATPIETVEPPFARARAHAAKVEGILGSDEMIRKPHSDLEAMLDGQGKEWARLMLEENLRLRAQLERKTPVVGADGVERQSTRDSERHLETVLGRVPVARLAYQAPGSPDLHPMDAALNLPRATSPVRRSRSARSKSSRSGRPRTSTRSTSSARQPGTPTTISSSSAPTARAS